MDKDQHRVWRAGMARPALLLTLVLALYAQGEFWSHARKGEGVDFYQFWLVGPAARAADVEDFYSPAGRMRLGEISGSLAHGPGASARLRGAAGQNLHMYDGAVETTGTPLFYCLFGLFRSGDYDRDLLAFQGVSLLVWLGSLLLLARKLRFEALDTLAAAALLGFWFAPLRENMMFANVNQLQLGMLTAAALAAGLRRQRLAGLLCGAVLGAAVVFKPNLAPAALLLGLWLLIDRQYARLGWYLAGAVAAAAGAVALPAAYYGSLEPWRGWLRALPELLGQGYRHWEGNSSPGALLWQWFGLEAGPWLPAALLAATAAMFRLARRPAAGAVEPARAFREALLVTGLGVAVSLLGFKLAWLHYYVLLVPLALYLLRPAGQAEGAFAAVRLTTAVAALVLLSIGPVAAATGLRSLHHRSAMLTLGTVLLLLTGLAQMLPRPTPAPPGRPAGARRVARVPAGARPDGRRPA